MGKIPTYEMIEDMSNIVWVTDSTDSTVTKMDANTDYNV